MASEPLTKPGVVEVVAVVTAPASKAEGVEGDYVVVHSDVGAKLRGASFARVAFEIDGFDRARRSGWSVLVQGMGHDATNAVHPSPSTSKACPCPHGHRAEARLLRISTSNVSGRRFDGGAGREDPPG